MSMKKIIKEPESQPAPALMRAVHSVLEPQEESAPKIPPSVLYGSNLKQMKGFHNLRSTLKRDSFLKEFIKSGVEALEPYEVGEETKYDIQIVKFIMQTAEDRLAQATASRLGLLDQYRPAESGNLLDGAR